VNFTIDVQFAQATGDQLCHLAAEVYDKKAVVGCLAHVMPTRPGARFAQEVNGNLQKSTQGLVSYVAIAPEGAQISDGGNKRYDNIVRSCTRGGCF